MDYSIFFGKTICDIDEKLYLELKNNENNDFLDLRLNDNVYNYIKNNINNINNISFLDEYNIIVIKYNESEDFNEIYNILLEIYTDYYDKKKQSFIESLSEEDFLLRKKFNDLGYDYFKNEFNIIMFDLYNENIVTHQKETELGNIITIKYNFKNNESLKIFIEDENGLHFLISFYHLFYHFRNLEIGYFEKGFNSYIRINKDGSIEINKKFSVIGRKLYMKKNVYQKVDLWGEIKIEEHPRNYLTNLMEYSIKKVYRNETKDKETLLTIYYELFEPFLYKGTDGENEIYEVLMEGAHGFEIKLFVKDGEIINEESRRLERGEIDELFDTKYIKYYY